MAKSRKLSPAELKWLEELQEVLDRCPSTRIAFFTVGDPDLGLHDATREHEITEELDKNGGEWSSAAEKIGARFPQNLRFPNAVHSTAG